MGSGLPQVFGGLCGRGISGSELSKGPLVRRIRTALEVAPAPHHRVKLKGCCIGATPFVFGLIPHTCFCGASSISRAFSARGATCSRFSPEELLCPQVGDFRTLVDSSARPPDYMLRGRVSVVTSQMFTLAKHHLGPTVRSGRSKRPYRGTLGGNLRENSDPPEGIQPTLFLRSHAHSR